MNQTADLGSNVTFSCTVTGHPKPDITWAKDNDPYSLKFNPRAKVMTDGGRSLSQLIMTGIKGEDYGKYHCVANSSAGVKESRWAFLLPEITGKRGWFHKNILLLPISYAKLFPNSSKISCLAAGFLSESTLCFSRLSYTYSHLEKFRCPASGWVRIYKIPRITYNFIKILIFRPFQFQEKEKTNSGYNKVSHGIFNLTFRMLQLTSSEVTVTKYDEI